jgi:hypothetical protein
MGAVVQTGRVLRRQDHSLLGHPRRRSGIVGLEHRIHIYTGMIKQPIRRFGLGPISTAALRHIARIESANRLAEVE